jgi:hypothetical protein
VVTKVSVGHTASISRAEPEDHYGRLEGGNTARTLTTRMHGRQEREAAHSLVFCLQEGGGIFVFMFGYAYHFQNLNCSVCERLK